MAIVSTYTAAQIVAPGEDPVFFDEIGCLRDYVARTTLPQGAALYVADHRTGQWIDAARAVYTRTLLSTPMASGLVAHADLTSRDGDPVTQGGQFVEPAAVIGGRPGEATR